MYPIPPIEKLVETKVCRHCQASFPITDKDLEFYDKVSPVFNGKKYAIPTPTMCPDCSAQKKLVWRNDKKFYKITIEDKECISMYRPDTDWNIIDGKNWWGQDYDATHLDCNFGKTFFEQFWEILRRTPHPHIITMDSENSDYTNFNAYCKNSYLCAAGNYSENIYYCYNAEKCTNCIDSLFIFDSEKCSNLIHSSKCYNLHYSMHCEDCSDSWFLEDCNGCSHCYCCVGLKNKSYNIYNVQYSKEDYKERIQKMKDDAGGHITDQFTQFREFSQRYVKSSNHNFNSQNSRGEYILNSDHCEDCYIMAAGCKDCKHAINGFPGLMDSQNICYCWEDASLFYECMWSGASCSKNAFCTLVLSGSSNNLYCDYCIACENCFWCSWLHNKSYCILNKQYTKEEYETLVPKIIEHMMKTGEWWEFFPSSLSPFGYNETVAQEYYPMTRDQILASPMRGGGTNAESTGGVRLEASEWSPLTPLHKGGESETFLHTLPRHPSDATPSFLKGNIFNWSDYESPFPKVEKIIPADKLPQDIKDIPDDILNWAIECEVTKKPFRIIKQELEFYRKHHLPIPKRHPDQRHLDRMAQRNPRKLFERKCDCCHTDMITTYAPERPERVYCEECYNREVIW